MKPTPHASRSFTSGRGPSNMLCVSPSFRWKASSRVEEPTAAWGRAMRVWNAPAAPNPRSSRRARGGILMAESAAWVGRRILWMGRAGAAGER